MARATPKKSAIKTHSTPSQEPTEEAAAPQEESTPTSLGWGWRLAVVVWILGFGGLGLYELIGLLVKVFRR